MYSYSEMKGVHFKDMIIQDVVAFKNILTLNLIVSHYEQIIEVAIALFLLIKPRKR